MELRDLAGESLEAALARVARHYAAGRYQAAVDLSYEIDAAHGALAETQHQRGLALYALGNKDGGLHMIQDAATFLPENGAIQADIGALLAQDGRYEEALLYFEEATRLAPHYAPGWSNLGAVWFALEAYSSAIAPLQKAVEIDPNLLDAQLNLATALARAQRFRQAADAYYRVLALDPNDVAAHLGLSAALYRLERHDSALYHAEKALELRPNATQAQFHIGNALASLGQMEAAADHLLAASQGPGGIGALSRLIHLRKTTRESPEFEKLSRILRQLEETEPEVEPEAVHFAAGKAFADIGDFDASFAHYTKGNAITAETVHFDVANHIEQVDRMIEVVTRDRVKHLSDSAGVQDIAPIFVCGMPRSGTTLTELMLSRHSQVQAGGELQAAMRALGQVRPLVDYLEGNVSAEPTADMFTQVGEYYVEAVRREGLTQEIITDKLPINHLYVGLLALALPRANFVILQRHPLDCCLSNWTQHFGRNQAFSSRFDQLGQVYMQYHRITSYWCNLLPERVHLLQYEDLVTHSEHQIRVVLDVCGLGWEDAVMEPSRSTRPVNTASIAQVREPIYQSSRARWRPYGTRLKPLAEEVRDLLSDEDKALCGFGPDPLA